MAARLAFVLVSYVLLVPHATAQVADQQLVGTWSTKSGKVVTGPKFYNPETETIDEPELTGISYSFTADGHYEEALFRAIPNPSDPRCPGAIVQWQHGSFIQSADTSLELTPIAVDGRQLLSQPCVSSKSTLTRYHQNETFSKAEIETDSYNGRLRLNLYGWDGTPINPMWLEYISPQMLPTTTLNPISATASGTSPTSSGYKLKRALGIDEDVLQEKILKPLARGKLTTTDRWFWVGIGSVSLGSVLLFCV